MMDERFKKQAEERQAHREKLEKEEGLVGHPKAKELYELVWEHGHSCGLYEVAIYYREFATLLSRQCPAGSECARFKALQAELKDIQKELFDLRESFPERFQQWRGVETPCPKCNGSGVRGYANTTTWRGGIGGQMLTDDVCDACWGTGDLNHHGADLRKLLGEMKALQAEVKALQDQLDRRKPGTSRLSSGPDGE